MIPMNWELYIGTFHSRRKINRCDWFVDNRFKTLLESHALIAQFLRDNMRKHFQQDYLSELIYSLENCSRRRRNFSGDIVIIGFDNTKRVNWLLRCITELFSGKDNVGQVPKLTGYKRIHYQASTAYVFS